jgi:hypothetical protein
MRVLFIGDIVGRTGRNAVKQLLPEVNRQYKLNLVIANAENAAGGFGLTRSVAEELFGYGINCLTMGNHTWDNKDVLNIINDPRVVRPLNFSPRVAGQGWTIIEKKGIKIAVVNLIGQVFMDYYNSPFMVYDEFFEYIKKSSDIIMVDFHAEATSEKLAFANYVDGQVACVVGTHTHIQTADEKILPGGTAYITDLGLTGATDSILGMAPEEVIQRFQTGIPRRFKVATGDGQLEGVVVDINEQQGLAKEIIRIRLKN